MPAVVAVVAVAAMSSAGGLVAIGVGLGITSTLAASVVGGIIVGAVAGGVTAAVMGDDVLKGALMGGLAGGVAGYGFGAAQVAQEASVVSGMQETAGIVAESGAVEAGTGNIASQMATNSLSADQMVAETAKLNLDVGNDVAKSTVKFAGADSSPVVDSGTLVSEGSSRVGDAGLSKLTGAAAENTLPVGAEQGLIGAAQSTAMSGTDKMMIASGLLQGGGSMLAASAKMPKEEYRATHRFDEGVDVSAPRATLDSEKYAANQTRDAETLKERTPQVAKYVPKPDEQGLLNSPKTANA